jgi:hypothetical protein
MFKAASFSYMDIVISSILRQLAKRL